MQAWTDWAHSSRSGRSKHRRRRHSTLYAWLWVLGGLLAVAGVGALVWQMRDGAHSLVANGSSAGPEALSESPVAGAAQWQQDVLNALETSVQQVGVGQIAQAETTVDRAAELLTGARLTSERSGPAFFQLATAGLDRVWSQQPDDNQLFEHVTRARIALATLRVAGNETSAEAGRKDSIASSPANALGGNALPGNGPPSTLPNATAEATANTTVGAGAVPANSVSIRATRKIAANSVLNPAALGSDYLDATRMPKAAEILLPPASQSLDDNVRVENLTIAGASQTLDAIRWSNVTFVGTRLRYGMGPLVLDNVHFVGCTFEFPTDVRGARLANAIALGQTSFTSD